MKSKKRNKQVSPPLQPQTSNPSTKTDESSCIDPLIINECRRGKQVFSKGNHIKALKIMEEACQKNKNSGLVHRVYAEICMQAISENQDLGFKAKYASKALQSAREAVILSRNSIEFAYFYARLLFDIGEYEKAKIVGEMALAITDPVDPAKESYRDSILVYPSPQARIAYFQEYVHNLVDECIHILENNIHRQISQDEIRKKFESKRRLAALNMAKDIENGNGGKKLQVMPEPEVKKATKTPEERKKEIEARVTAARLVQALQQNSDSSQNNFEIPKSKPLEGTTSVSQNIKSLSSTNALMEEKVRLYLNSMSVNEMQNLLEVDIYDLLAHFGSSKDKFAYHQLIVKAFAFGRANGSWEFWMCCYCKQKFAGSVLHFRHVKNHLRSLPPINSSVLPSRLHKDWCSMITDGTWKPVDAASVLPILEEQWNWLYSTNKYVQSTAVLKAGDFSDTPLEHDILRLARDFYSTQRWPLSDDPERALLLDKIQTRLIMLLKSNFLAAIHVEKVIHYALKESQCLLPGSRLRELFLDQTHLCICFLGASQLETILEFVNEISQFSTRMLSEKKNSVDKIVYSSIVQLNIKERIVLHGNSLCVLLEKPSSQAETTREGYANDTDDDDAAAATCILCSDKTCSRPPISLDAFMRWIFTGLSDNEHLMSRDCLGNKREYQGIELCQTLEKNHQILHDLCGKKCDRLSSKEALQAIWGLCLNEREERRLNSEYVPKSYETVLRKQQKELLELHRKNDVPKKSRYLLKAIKNILKEAQSINFNHEETLADFLPGIFDVETPEDGYSPMQSSLHHVDTCIEQAIRRASKYIDLELLKSDTGILRIAKETENLELKINSFAADDYRAILLPLVKSYIQVHIVELLRKDDRDKTEKAREANLAKVSLDAKRSVNKGGNQLKPAQKKSKNKLNKKHENTMQLKTSVDNKHFLLVQGSEEQVAADVVSDGCPTY